MRRNAFAAADHHHNILLLSQHTTVTLLYYIRTILRWAMAEFSYLVDTTPITYDAVGRRQQTHFGDFCTHTGGGGGARGGSYFYRRNYVNPDDDAIVLDEWPSGAGTRFPYT